MEKQITVKSIQTKREMNDFVSFPDRRAEYVQPGKESRSGIY